MDGETGQSSVRPGGEGDDQPPRAPVDVAAARRRARPPAIALILVGLINAGLALLVVVSGFFTGGFGLGSQEGFIGVIDLLAALATIAGGLNLHRLNAYWLVRTGSILAMVPCISLCLILGLPIGVWALVTASSPDVRAAFRNRKA